MARRSLQFVLVFSLAYWASGLAHFVHERTEHEHATAALGSAERSVRVADHDEAGCPVCQALATMRADRPVGPVLLVARFDLVGFAVPPSQVLPIAARLLAILSRGPPTIPA